MSRHMQHSKTDWLIDRLKEVEKGRIPTASPWVRHTMVRDGILTSHYVRKQGIRGRGSKIYELHAKGKQILNDAKITETKLKELRAKIKIERALVKARKEVTKKTTNKKIA